MAQAKTKRSTREITLHDDGPDELLDLLRLALELTNRLMQIARRPLPPPTMCVEVINEGIAESLLVIAIGATAADTAQKPLVSQSTGAGAIMERSLAILQLHDGLVQTWPIGAVAGRMMRL